MDFWERFRDANSVSKSKLQSFEPFEKVTFNINNNVASVKAVTHTYFVKYDASVDKINQWIPAAPEDLRTEFSLNPNYTLGYLMRA